MSRRTRGVVLRRWILWLVLLVTAAAPIALVVETADARPGGGQSYQGGQRSSGGSSSSPSRSSSGSGYGSSGSSGSSSGGGGGGGEFVGLFIQLLFAEPKLALALAVILVLVWLVRRGWSKLSDWSSQRQKARWAEIAEAGGDIKPHVPQRRAVLRSAGPRAILARITAFDPDFSQVLLDDFVQALFVRVHEARGEGTFAALLPYLSDAARAALARHPVTGIDNVVIGAMRYVAADASADPAGGPLSFVAEIEANYTERTGDDVTSYYVIERWTFSRSRAARSRPFAHARSLDCPNCGGALKDATDMKCRYCGASVAPAEFDWLVSEIEERGRTAIEPTLTTYTDETGNKLATVVTEGARDRFDAIVAKDAASVWEALRARLETAYAEINDAWSENALERARAFVSDGFFRSQSYWMREYAKQGLQNKVENAHISEVELAEARSDAHYDAVTVRIFAAAIDYLVRTSDGRQVAGDRDRPRAYSEYWTLVRGAAVRGAPRADKACPNCGAELAVNQAGECGTCKVHVTAGEFDWVLSRIEQDEAYEG